MTSLFIFRNFTQIKNYSFNYFMALPIFLLKIINDDIVGCETQNQKVCDNHKI